MTTFRQTFEVRDDGCWGVSLPAKEVEITEHRSPPNWQCSPAVGFIFAPRPKFSPETHVRFGEEGETTKATNVIIWGALNDDDDDSLMGPTAVTCV